MEQLPKIVGQRLQAFSRVEAHPDANLLTAYAEKSLLPREQVQVLEHLSACAECREVVAHAQPEEALQHVGVAAAAAHVGVPRRPWFSGAAVKWVGLAACVIVVGAVVISTQLTKPIVRPIASNSEPVIVAKNESQTQPAPSSPAEETKEKDTLGVPARMKSAPDVATKRDFDQLAGLERRRLENTITNDSPRERGQADQSLNGLAAPSSSPVSVVGGGAAGQLAAAQPVSAPQTEDAKSTKKEFSADKVMRAPATTTEVAQAQSVAALPPPPPPPAAKPATKLADSQATRAESESVQTYYNQKDGYVGGAAIGGIAKMRAVVIPMWQLSEDGKLLKSLDHGQNWQPVPVDDKSIFHALCVTGNEIWVGGKQGSLFYSSNSGQQWEQVKPMANGQTLTADITAIEFKDLKHGRLSTADHQTWTTNDDGHSWKLETR